MPRIPRIAETPKTPMTKPHPKCTSLNRPAKPQPDVIGEDRRHDAVAEASRLTPVPIDDRLSLDARFRTLSLDSHFAVGDGVAEGCFD